MSAPLVSHAPPGGDRSLDRPGFVTGAPKILLRLEGAAVLCAASAAYAQSGGGWGLFALLFFAPDVSMLGYLLGPKVGSVLYNSAHFYALPLILGGVGVVAAQPALVGPALIWIAHIGFDRLMGYGLKYQTGFAQTHLGALGFAKRPA